MVSVSSLASRPQRFDPCALCFEAPPARRAQDEGQVSQAFQAMDGTEFVDVGHDRARTHGSWFISIVAQERIEPDQPPAGLVEALHFPCQSFSRVAIESVADEQDDGALSEHPARPPAVE